jgi:hypothetical protein
LIPSVDFIDDAIGVGGPDEGLGVVVVLGEVAIDGSLEVDQRVKGAALQAPPGEGGEEGLDRIDPRAGGRREVEGPARMPDEPGADLGMLVGGVVVEDGVDQFAGRHGALDGIEEADELLMPVPRHALADDAAVEHVQRREQGRRAVSDVVVGHGAGPALLDRQPRLRPIERLDLRFLVDREHQAVRRRIEIEADHVAQLGGERRIGGQLEAPHPVRLEAMRRPDPLHRAQRYAAGRRHRPAGPMGRLAGRIAKRQRDDTLNQLRRQGRQSGLAGPVAHQAGRAFAHEPLLPAPDAGLGHLGPAHDLRRAAARSGRQDDTRPPDVLLRAVAICHDPLQPVAVRSAHLDTDSFAHASACHAFHHKGIL